MDIPVDPPSGCHWTPVVLRVPSLLIPLQLMVAGEVVSDHPLLPAPRRCEATCIGHMAGRRSHDPTVLAWLRAAQPGVIAVTTGPVSGNCDRSYKGAWRLNFTESRTVASSTAACLDKCDRCANCNYISVSAWERDCSWFMQRDTTTPLALATGFLSGPSRRLNASLAASVLARQGRHFVKGMVENPAVGHHKITQCHTRPSTAVEPPLRQRPHPRAEVTSEVTWAEALGLGFNLQGVLNPGPIYTEGLAYIPGLAQI